MPTEWVVVLINALHEHFLVSQLLGGHWTRSESVPLTYREFVYFSVDTPMQMRSGEGFIRPLSLDSSRTHALTLQLIAIEGYQSETLFVAWTYSVLCACFIDLYLWFDLDLCCGDVHK